MKIQRSLNRFSRNSSLQY